MGRRCTCNELISNEQREKVLHLFTETNSPYHQISRATLVPIDKIKSMTKELQRPKATPKLTDKQRTELLMGWH